MVGVAFICWTRRLKTREKLKLGSVGAKTMTMTTMPGWMFKEEFNRGETKKGDRNKMPAQLKKNMMSSVDKTTIEDLQKKDSTLINNALLE